MLIADLFGFDILRDEFNDRQLLRPPLFCFMLRLPVRKVRISAGVSDFPGDSLFFQVKNSDGYRFPTAVSHAEQVIALLQEITGSVRIIAGHIRQIKAELHGL